MLAYAVIGLKNLRRHLRRTLLTVGMVFGGTMLLCYMAGLAEGTYDEMIGLSTQSYVGHFQVMAPGYHDSPSLFKTVNNPGVWEERLANTPGVVAVSSRVETGGLAASGNRTTGILLVGVDPIRESKVSTMAGTLVEGEWLQPVAGSERVPVVIGSGVAKRLRVGVGDEITFVGQAADGSIAADLFVVSGLAETGSAQIDSGVVVAPLADTQELLVLGNRVHRVAGVVSRVTKVKKVIASVTQPDPESPQDIRTWHSLIPGLYESIEVDRNGQHTILLILLAVVALGVMNTMMMSVIERTRELGVLLAIGTTPGQVLAITLWEAVWMSLIGVALGVAVGALLAATIAIPYPGGPIDFGGVSIAAMNPRNSVRGGVIYPSIILAVAVLASILPAWRASRLPPAEALRHV